jgi:hypothetical protein
MISVLFVRKDSVYKTLGVDCWDMERDAKLWPGGNSIVAHPPCRAWGKFKAFAKPRPDEKDLAIWSITQIRKWGGVLEHPRHSSLWKEQSLPLPGEIDQYGGFSICVDQFWWGHRAQKSTLLYICGCAESDLPPIPLKMDAVQYVINRAKKKPGQPLRNAKKEVSKRERGYAARLRKISHCYCRNGQC